MYADYQIMKPSDFSGILTKGGTILGTSRQPFKLMRVPDENGLDKVEAMKHTYRKLKLECLVVLGGNGSQKTANLLREEGLNVVSLPKTIDNDLWGTDVTFGFQSAINVAANAIDCIHTTAASHGRVFIVEVMGHKVGWLTLYAGIAGGADIILLPEIPYDIDVIVEALKERSRQGKRFSILAVAEGAISKEDAILSKKELKEKKKNQVVYPSVAYALGAQITEKTGQEVRVTVPGHTQRGGEPCPYDRVLSTRLGAAAAKHDSGKEIRLHGSSEEQRDHRGSAGSGCRQVKDGRPKLLHDSGSQDDRNQLWRRITAFISDCRKQGVKEYVIHCTVPQMAPGGI